MQLEHKKKCDNCQAVFNDQSFRTLGIDICPTSAVKCPACGEGYCWMMVKKPKIRTGVKIRKEPERLIDFINVSLDKHSPIGRLQEILKRHDVFHFITKNNLERCEYSKNSQFIALLALPEEGDPEKLFQNINLDRITEDEIAFLTEILEWLWEKHKIILSDIPEKLPFEIVSAFIKKGVNRFCNLTAVELVQRCDLNTLTLNELCIFGLGKRTENLLGKIASKIFTHPDLADLLNKQKERKELGTEDEEGYEDYVRFVQKVLARLK